MRLGRDPWLLAVVAPAAGALCAAACGARTALEVGDGVTVGGNATTATQGGGGAGGEGGAGGGGMGGREEGGGGAGGDPQTCDDPEAALIYIITGDYSLYAFDPEQVTFDFRGTMACPSGAAPFSMGVRSDGIAHVLFNDGNLFAVDLKDAHCEATSYAPGQLGFEVFGMGYAQREDGSEELFVSDIDYPNELSKGLGRIDTEDFTLSFVGPFVNEPGHRIELTAVTEQLYAFVLDEAVGGGYLAEVDKDTGEMTSFTVVPIGSGIGSWHFAHWGDSFYFFAEPSGTDVTDVWRFSPEGNLTLVTSIGEAVPGAGVAPCEALR